MSYNSSVQHSVSNMVTVLVVGKIPVYLFEKSVRLNKLK